MDIAKFKKMPIMGILRGVSCEEAAGIVEASIAGGLETLEITMNTPDAGKIITGAVKAASGKLMIGAGTVLTVESLKLAMDSGATFIVMPTLVEDVLDYCATKVIPVFPGALTPTEIYKAWKLGATMVKVFPSGVFGSDYFKEIKGPFANIELMACGGVRAENINEYFAKGASAVAFGASIYRRDWINNKEFTRIESGVRAMTSEFTKVCAQK